MDWKPIDTRPLATVYYLVGHVGWQERLLFFNSVHPPQQEKDHG